MQKRYNSQNQYALNKRAFDAVLHQDESCEGYEDTTSKGAYHCFKASSRVPALDYFGAEAAEPAACQTFPTDFCIAVDIQIQKKIINEKDLKMFTDCYILGLTVNSDYSPQERKRLSYLEQRMGRAFRNCGLWPVSKFFKCIRQKH